MKFKIFTMLLTLGVLSVVPMIYMGKFDPMAFFDSSISKGSAELKNLKNSVPAGLSNVSSSEKVQVYKWRDKNGIMQFSNTPPTVNHAESILINPNNNLIQAIKIPEKKETKKTLEKQSASPYSAAGMKKVMHDAKGVEQMLQKRHEQQQKMMNNL